MTLTLKVLIGVTIVLIAAFAVATNTRAAEEPQLVRVNLKDNQVQVSQFVVVAGRAVKFEVANEGTMPHQFVVRPIVAISAVSGEQPVIAARTVRTIDQTLSPGIYRLSCDLLDHAERGMVSAIAVETSPRTTFPIPVQASLSLLAFVSGCVYIIGDSLGLRLIRR